MDTLLSLRVLDKVAELRSFAAASERLGLSPAMTTKHVQHVEERVGARLLNRTSRNVSLTEAGSIYLMRLRPLLEGLEDIEAQISQTAIKPAGRLRVSLPAWMATPKFAKLAAAFHRQNPEVILELDPNSRFVNLVEDGFDLAIRVSATLQPGLIARKLGQIRFRVVASPDFLDRHGRPSTLSDLQGAPFVAYTALLRDGRVLIPLPEGPKELTIRPVLLSGNESFLMLAACEGMGFCFMPDWLADDEIASGRLETLLPDHPALAAPLFAVYPDRSYVPAKLRSFLDFLVASGFPKSW